MISTIANRYKNALIHCKFIHKTALTYFVFICFVLAIFNCVYMPCPHTPSIFAGYIDYPALWNFAALSVPFYLLYACIFFIISHIKKAPKKFSREMSELLILLILPGWMSIQIVKFVTAPVEKEIRLQAMYALTKNYTALETALSEYRKEKGTYPETMSDLIPNYLSKEPSTGVCNVEFHYQKIGNDEFQIITAFFADVIGFQVGASAYLNFMPGKAEAAEKEYKAAKALNEDWLAID